jgi:hypothetical protein
MSRENIIKSINETLKKLPHKAYIWKKDFPQVTTVDELTAKRISIEIHALKYPITQSEGIFFTVCFAFTPWINERGWDKISTEVLNILLSFMQGNK